MPLLKPEIARTLREAGLGGDPAEGDIKDILDSHGLSLEETVRELSNVVKFSTNDTLKSRGIETALKMHGVMKDTGVQAPSVTFIINDPKSAGITVNPILIPRGM